jgi:hypothetical protein
MSLFNTRVSLLHTFSVNTFRSSSQEPDYAGLSRTLLDLHRTGAALTTGALVSLLIIISQGDTWQSVEPLISLLGQIDEPLFQTAHELLMGGSADLKSAEFGRRTSKRTSEDLRNVGRERCLEGSIEVAATQKSAELEGKVSPEKMEQGASKGAGTARCQPQNGVNVSLQAVDREEASSAYKFVQLVQESEPDSRLRLGLLGRMADALWFRGLRAQAATLVRTILTQELNRPPHGRPSEVGQTPKPLEFGRSPESSDVAQKPSSPQASKPSDFGPNFRNRQTVKPSEVARTPKPSESIHTWRLDLHNLSDGGACALLMSWLHACQADVRKKRGDPPRRVEVVTGWGKHTLVGGRPAGVSSVQQLVGGILEAMGSPFKTSVVNEGAFIASGEDVRNWLDSCPAIELVDKRV